MTATDQRVTALKRANAVRFARAQVKRRLAEHTTRRASLLAAAAQLTDPDPELITMPVRQLLEACWQVCPDGARALMRRARVLSDRRIGDLTDAERWRLVTLLRTGLAA